MRYAAAFACFLVGIKCMKYATGDADQLLFSQGALWLWWIVAAAWLANSFYILFWGAK